MKYKFNFKKTRFIKEIIEKRFNILIGIIICIFSIVAFRLFTVQLIQNEKYTELALENATNIVDGPSAPRGRIYDRNYNIIVDNIPVKTIYYKKIKGTTVKEEIDLAYKVAEIIELDYSKLSETNLKEFWLAKYEKEAEKKIKKNEWTKYNERKLSDKDIYNLKISRITEEELASFSEFDKETAYIYYLMNNGYSYDEKIIKNEDVTEQEYANISENAEELKGFNTKLDWERSYPYGDTFKTILGNVSSQSQGIPAELKDDYLKKGYSLNDRVGISYLEYQYEDILKGTKPKYKILSDNSYELVEEGKRGNDIVLSIDINLQQELEKILTEEVLATKQEPNTEYYDKSMAVIQDPNTGEILAMAGKQVVKEGDEYKVYDYTPGITTSPVIVGSVVKGASMLVGYNTGNLQIGEKIKDECIKIKDTPEKCSWSKRLGTLDDIKALAQSSNVYQFKIAIRVGGGNYQYNQPLKINEEAFDIYRNMYNSFGLGVETGIDLPVESTGYKGTSTLAGHLLDFVIGQYDTYTPIQLSQYVTTLANGGDRLEPHLLKEVYVSNKEGTLDELKSKTERKVLNKIDTEEKYLNRVKEGFIAVMNGNGLGVGYMGNAPNPAGKTGTSESFYDSDGDGVIDKETVSKTFIGYAPADNPKMSFVVLSPNVSHNYNNSSYSSNVNKRISSRISNKFFELYP